MSEKADEYEGAESARLKAADERFTPGPWYSPSHAPTTIWKWTNDVRRGVQIATTRVADEVDGNLSPKNSPIRSDEAEANARLLAAAPELLAALREYLALDEAPGRELGISREARMTLARAAVRKATGESA